MDNKVEQKFDDWNKLKKKTNSELNRRLVKRGEVWWAKVGQNIGVEIYGKHELFSRPVLVIKPIEGGNNAIVLPMTSKRHTGSWYFHFKFKGKDEYAVLTQIKSIDTSRLIKSIGEIDENTMLKIIDYLVDYMKK